MAEEEGSSEGGGVVRELLAIFGFKVEEKGLKEGENQLEEFLEKAKGFAEGVAAVFAVDEIYEWAEAQVKAIGDIEHAASKLGVTTEQVQEYQYVANQAS